MEQGARKVSVVKNVAAQMSAALIQTALGFAVRKLFVIYLTTELLGLNGLMQSIIGMLSIAELGVGEAINYSLYKPLAGGDKQQVNAIMQLYKKLYVGIAAVIVLLGVALLPFLHLFIDPETTYSMSYIYKIYGLFLLDTFLSYCLAYSRNIITADQKDYIVTNVDTISQIVLTALQMVILALTKNYVPYLVIKTVVTFGRNIVLHLISRKMHPYLREKTDKKLSTEYIKKLKENVKALFITKVSYFIVSGTDNMLLSSFVSLTSVAIYNNYIIILNLLNKTFNTIFDKAKAGVGNFIALSDNSKLYGLFKNIFFVNFLMTSYTSIGLFIVCNEIIAVWLGEEFLWAPLIVGLVAFNNYSRYILQTCECFRGAVGLYSPRPFVKYLALLEGVINLLASLALIFVLDNRVLGIFLGTSVSTVVSTIVVPWIVYKFLFERPLKEFFALYVKYMAAAIAATAVSLVLAIFLFTENHLINILIGIAVSTVGVSAVYLPLFIKTEEFKYCKDLALGLIGRKKG